MKQQGKFIQLNITEFETWLNKLNIARQINMLQCHHTWQPNYHNYNTVDPFQLMKNMESFQVQELGKTGVTMICQNATTFPDGNIMICRDFSIAPAGIHKNNIGALCIENIGNFDIGGDIMNDIHKQTIINLYTLLCKKFNIVPSTNTIVYHHWFDLYSGLRTNGKGITKSCPGTNCVSIMASGNTIYLHNRYI